MIHSIRMKNFKQHKDRTIVLEKGLNAIQGDNGAGKSTVLKAILFALFGASAAGAKEHLGTWGGGSPEVELDMTLGRVGRITVTRGFTKATVTQAGKMLASGQSPVARYIEDQIGMDAKLFKSMLYAQQGDAQALLKMGGAELQKKIETVANVEIVDKVITLANSDSLVYQGQLNGLGAMPDLDELRRRLQFCDTEASLQRKRAQEAEITAQQLAQIHAQHRAYYEEIRAKHAEFVKHQEQRARTEAALQHWNQQLDQLEAKRPAQIDDTQLFVTEADIAAERRRLDQMRGDLAKANEIASALKAADDRIQRLSRLEALLPELEKLRSEIVRRQSALESIRHKYAEAEHALTHSSCKACNRPFEGIDRARLQADLDEIQQEHAEAGHNLQTARDALGQWLSGNNVQEHDFPGVATSLELERGRYQDLLGRQRLLNPASPADIAALDAKIQTMVTALAEHNARERERQQWRQAFESAQAQVQQLRTTLAQMQQIVEPVEYDQVNQAERQLQSAAIALEEARRNLQLANHQVETLRQQQAAAAAQLEAGEKTCGQIQQVKHNLQLRSDLIKYLRDNRARFMTDTWASLTNHASSHISTITEGLITDLHREDDGEFFVSEKGLKVPVEELSGARKSIVGLCLRLSLGHLFYGDSGFVLLDEITADCSEANAARVSGLLKSLRSQVIMVTHRQGDAVNANHTIVL